MIIVCAVLAAALVAVTVTLVLIHARTVQRLTDAHGTSETAWVEERRELINRVQAPQFIPRPVPEQFELPEPEPDNSHLVGHIDFDGPGGD